jgi:hypothetical protein
MDSSRPQRSVRHKARFSRRSFRISTSIMSWISGFNVGFVVSVGAKRICSVLPMISWRVSNTRRMPSSFAKVLGDRLGRFHLELAEEKTQHLEFGRYARANAYRRGEKPKDFEFLGMTFFCGQTRHGVFKVKRKTSRKKLRQSLARWADWLRRYRNLLPTGDLLRQAKARTQGHLN